MYWEPTKLVANLRYNKLEDNDNLVILRTLNAGHMGETGDNFYRETAYQYAVLIDNINNVPKYNALWMGILITLIIVSLLAVAAALLMQRLKRRKKYLPVDKA
jgi:hypothetical protein